MNCFLITTLFLSYVAGAQDRQTLPFEPAYAAQQKVLTTKAIQQEVLQFRQIAQWHSSQDELVSAEAQRDLAQRHHDRTKALFDKQSASNAQLRIAFNKLEAAQSKVLKVRRLIDQARSQASIHKYLVIEEGNPGADLKREVADAMLVSLKAERTSLLGAAESARVNLAFYMGTVKNGAQLFKASVISEVEMEQRELMKVEAENSLNGILYQIKALDEAIKGLELGQERLQTVTS